MNEHLPKRPHTLHGPPVVVLLGDGLGQLNELVPGRLDPVLEMGQHVRTGSRVGERRLGSVGGLAYVIGNGFLPGTARGYEGDEAEGSDDGHESRHGASVLRSREHCS